MTGLSVVPSVGGLRDKKNTLVLGFRILRVLRLFRLRIYLPVDHHNYPKEFRPQ